MNFVIKYLKFIGAETGKRRENMVRDMLSKSYKATYLDCGCGDGTLTLERASFIGTREIFGIEILPEEMKKARQKKIDAKLGDLNKKMPFKDNMFDVITATQVIEHLYDVDVFVSEIYRILKKNGILIISTENLSAWHNIFALAIGLQPSAGPFISKKFTIGFHPLNKEHIKEHEIHPHLKEMIGHTRVIAYESFKKLFSSYNFSLIDEKAVGYYPFPGKIADIFADIDKRHALDVILKLQKK